MIFGMANTAKNTAHDEVAIDLLSSTYIALATDKLRSMRLQP
jgi:hypothetical protein